MGLPHNNQTQKSSLFNCPCEGPFIKHITLGGVRGCPGKGYGKLHGMGGVSVIVSWLFKKFVCSSNCRYQIDNIDCYISFGEYFK